MSLQLSSEPRIPQLKKAIFQLLDEATPLFDEWEKTKVSEPSGSQPHQSLPFTFESVETLRQCAGWNLASEILRGNPEFSKHFDTLVGYEGGSRTRLEIEGLLSSMIERSLPSAIEHGFGPSARDRIYSEFEELLVEPVVRIRASSLIVGIELEAEHHELEDSLILTRISDAGFDSKLASFLGNDPLSPILSALKIWSASVLEYRSAERKVIGDENAHVDDNFSSRSDRKLRSLLYALRLQKPGSFTAPIVRLVCESWPLGGWQRYHSPADIPLRPASRHSFYKLSPEEGENVKVLFRQAQKCQEGNDRSLILALRWFLKAGFAVEKEDWLLALLISAEALFMSDQDHKELRYRLGLRMAFFLGGNRILISKFVNDVYDLRSKMVHGTPTDETIRVYWDSTEHRSPQATFDVLTRFEDMLRNSLKKMLTQEEAVRPSKHPEKWDQLIFSTEWTSSES